MFRNTSIDVLMIILKYTSVFFSVYVVYCIGFVQSQKITATSVPDLHLVTSPVKRCSTLLILFRFLEHFSNMSYIQKKKKERNLT